MISFYAENPCYIRTLCKSLLKLVLKRCSNVQYIVTEMGKGRVQTVVVTIDVQHINSTFAIAVECVYLFPRKNLSLGNLRYLLQHIKSSAKPLDFWRKLRPRELISFSHQVLS